MALVYWNENSNQLTPVTPSDLVGVGDSVAYDALSVVSPNSTGGLVVANKTGNIDVETKLLLHFDNNLIDSELTPKSITSNNLTFSNTISKFGGYSAAFNGTAIVVVPSSADFAFGTGDFTIDFWVRPTTANSLNTFYSQYDNANNYTGCSSVNDGNLYWEGRNNNIVNFSFSCSNAALTAGVWHHVALVRSGNTAYIFIDGVSKTLTTYWAFSSSRSCLQYNNPFYVGKLMLTGYTNFNGHMDEFRVSKGIARWTSNFTPRTDAYGNSGIVGTPYMKLGYVNAAGTSIVQTAKIWTDPATTSLKFDLASDTRLVITDSDIQFNGTSLLSSGAAIWSDVDGVISPTNSADIFCLGGLIEFCSDLMQINTNATFGANITVVGTANINQLTASSLTIGDLEVDGSGNLVAPSITLGGNATIITSSQNGSIAIGYGATAPAMTAGIAIGYNAQSTGNGSFALGNQANASAQGSSCIGYNSSASGLGSTAVGDSAEAEGNNSFAMGYVASVDSVSTNGIAIGAEAEVSGAIGGIAIGDSALCQGNNSVVIGPNANTTSTATSSVAIGVSSVTSGSQSIAIGNTATANASFALAFGVSSLAHGLASAAFGYNAKSNADYSLAIGYSSDAEGIGSIAIGYHATASGVNSVAIGYYAAAASANQIVLTTEQSSGVAAVQLNIVSGVADFVANIVKAANVELSSTTVPATPVAGMVYFDGTNFLGYDGSNWLQLDNA